jgi:two-component system, OmpR family, sensor histidine kinase CiaH
MFNKARLQLTFWYLLIIMTVSLSFSGIIYRAASDEIARFEHMQRLRFERLVFLPPAPLDLLEESQQRVLYTLIIINSIILFSSAGLGYILAGRTLKPIADMVEKQNRFISDASHELKTPLTSLKSAFEVFLRDKKSTLAEAKIVVKESIDEVDKLQVLSESLLRLNYYQKSDEILSANEIISLAVKRIAPKAKQKNITITQNLKDFKISGNQAGLVNLVVILLDNAIKYSSENQNILVKSEKNTIVVKDNGIGIAAKDLPHIFDRFYRSDLARSKSSNDGYGLGLSIAKEIADTNNCSINVQSKLGKGTTIQLAFS